MSFHQLLKNHHFIIDKNLENWEMEDVSNCVLEKACSLKNWMNCVSLHSKYGLKLKTIWEVDK